MRVQATKVDFPAKPAVSEVTKDFIRRCLSYSADKRPDVSTIFDDPFFKARAAQGKE